ncbi:MAG: hypothetical protein LBC92_00985 [Rickettsiales bacterium]|jgi:hypothetical protein|nr:hypothetical protein [Rickettsiales bacterium]
MLKKKKKKVDKIKLKKYYKQYYLKNREKILQRNKERMKLLYHSSEEVRNKIKEKIKKDLKNKYRHDEKYRERKIADATRRYYEKKKKK